MIKPYHTVTFTPNSSTEPVTLSFTDSILVLDIIALVEKCTEYPQADCSDLYVYSHEDEESTIAEFVYRHGYASALKRLSLEKYLTFLNFEKGYRDALIKQGNE